MDRLPHWAKWMLLAPALTLGGCIRPPAPEQIRITVTPRVAGCGEYASDLALDLKIDNTSRHSLHFGVMSEGRNPPVLYWGAFKVLDASPDRNLVDERLSPSPTVPVFGIADHATVGSRDTGDVVALIADVHPDDYAKVLRIELHDLHEHSYLSEPFSLCQDMTATRATGQHPPKQTVSTERAALPLTLKAARLLPLPTLAHLMLGAEGDRIVDATRPGYFGQVDHLMFYEQAIADPTEPSLCRARWIDVRLDKKGNVSSGAAEWRFGAPTQLYHAPSTHPAQTDQTRCAQLATTRNFFPAPDSKAAAAVARYEDVFNKRGPFANESVPAHWTPEITGRNHLPRGNMDEILAVKRIPCLPEHPDEDGCFQITDVEGNRIFSVYGASHWDKVRIDRIEGRWDMVLY